MMNNKKTHRSQSLSLSGTNIESFVKSMAEGLQRMNFLLQIGAPSYPERPLRLTISAHSTPTEHREPGTRTLLRTQRQEHLAAPRFAAVCWFLARVCVG
jgi:hypothetical protein